MVLSKCSLPQLYIRDILLGYHLTSGIKNAGTSAAGGGQKGNSLVGGSLPNMPGPRVLNSLYSMIRLREVKFAITSEP
jgi:hypothetical protein